MQYQHTDFLGYLRSLSRDNQLTKDLVESYQASQENQPEIKSLAGACEFKANMDSRTIQGYASVFDVQDLTDDTIKPGAYKESIKELQKRGLTHKALWQHDWMIPVGHSKILKEESKGLYFDDKISRVPQGDITLELVDDGTIEGISVGFQVVKQTIIEDKTARFGFRREINEAKLFEHSYVTFPALLEARVTRVQKHGLSALMPTMNNDLDLFGFLSEVAKQASRQLTALEMKQIRETIQILTNAIGPQSTVEVAKESESQALRTSDQPVTKFQDLLNFINK